ncbi:MAG: DUF6498-containing protein [Acidobacteriota bacterium]|nr:DUF6498-containing protein [Acidobacteriota bacterium]
MARRELALFMVTVALASYQEWSAGDLLWSLWISSLVLGYAFLIAALIGRPVIEISKNICRGKNDVPLTAGRVTTLVAIAILVSGFMVGFFTVHFGGFHFVHAALLDAFFPLADEPGVLAGGLTAGFLHAIRVALARHWPFVLISAVSLAPQFRRALGSDSDKVLMTPYKNVLRMHLMIFVIALCHAAGASGLVLYATLLAYFFPYEIVRGIRESREGAAQRGA